MTKVEVIRNEMVKAMKEQNKERKNALSKERGISHS